MDSMDLEVLRAACEWSASGNRALLLTVVRTWGSAPRPVGSMMVIREDGHVRGSVSGGCVEDDLIERVRRGEFQAASPRLLSYGASAEEVHRFGLPCGGTLQLVAERVTAQSLLPALLEALKGPTPIARQLDLASGAVALSAAGGAAPGALAFDGERLVTVHGPRHRLVLIGAAQLSRHVAGMAQSLDYAVTVCDPRDEYLDEWDIAGVTLSREMPDDLLLRLRLDSHSAVLALTHDPKLDELALIEALKSPAFYVGAIGSRASQEKRRARLALFDVGEDQLARLHGPVGLYLGGRTPPEIALSIMAEMTAVRNGVPVLQTHAIRRDAGSPPNGCILAAAERSAAR